MGLDGDLLATALGRREELERLQDDVVRARSSFMRSVRHLHVAGASLREIAEALGLSHQRVHQIVEEGGPVDAEWTPGEPGLLTCSFCGRTQREVSHLVAGPGANICGDCTPVVAGVGSAGASAPSCSVEGAPGSRCSFCGKRSGKVTWLVKTAREPEVRICNECVALVQEILASSGP